MKEENKLIDFKGNHKGHPIIIKIELQELHFLTEDTIADILLEEEKEVFKEIQEIN